MNHSWSGLSASAAILFGVITDTDIVYRQQAPQLQVHGFDNLKRLSGGAYVGLIGDHYQQVALSLKGCYRRHDARQELKVVHRPWRIRLAILDDRLIQRPIPIEEDCPPVYPS